MQREISTLIEERAIERLFIERAYDSSFRFVFNIYTIERQGVRISYAPLSHSWIDSCSVNCWLAPVSEAIERVPVVIAG